MIAPQLPSLVTGTILDPAVLLDIGQAVFALVLFAVSLYAWYMRRQTSLVIVALAFLMFFVKTAIREFYSKHHHQLLHLHRHRLLPIPALVNLYHFLHESGRQLDVFQTQGVSCHQLLVRELIQVSLQKLFEVTVREHYRVIGLAMLR